MYNYFRINKTLARRLYNTGVTVYLLPCDILPDENIGKTIVYDANKEYEKTWGFNDDFDYICKWYKGLVCHHSQGHYPAFYIKKEVVT